MIKKIWCNHTPILSISHLPYLYKQMYIYIDANINVQHPTSNIPK